MSSVYDNYDVVVKNDGVEVQNYQNWKLKAPSHVLEDDEVMTNIEDEFGLESEDFDETDIGVYECVLDDGSVVTIEVCVS